MKRYSFKKTSPWLGTFLCLLVLLFSFQNCSPVSFSQELASLEHPSPAPVAVPLPDCATDSSLCPPMAPMNCSFDGKIYQEGETVKAYISSSVPMGSQCESQIRMCQNGTFNGSYAFSYCEVGAPQSCLFNGQTIAHGQTISAYQNSSVAFGNSCVSQVRLCQNGELLGEYKFATCAVGISKSCLFHGNTIAHDQEVKAFAVPIVPYGDICVSESRKCKNGEMGGSYPENSCEVEKPIYSWILASSGGCSASPSYSYGLWSNCSLSGVQTRTSQCINHSGVQLHTWDCRDQKGNSVSDVYCANKSRPASSTSCSVECAGHPVVTQTCVPPGPEFSCTIQTNSKSDQYCELRVAEITHFVAGFGVEDSLKIRRTDLGSAQWGLDYNGPSHIELTRQQFLSLTTVRLTFKVPPTAQAGKSIYYEMSNVGGDRKMQLKVNIL